MSAVIINMYGTIVPNTGDLYLREGVLSFLERQKDKQIVISARKPRQEAIEDVNILGIGNLVIIYGLEDMKKVIGADTIQTEVEDPALYAAQVVTGQRIPDFFTTRPSYRTILRKTKTIKHNSVVISHHPWDIEDSLLERIPTIEVPTFEDNNDTFSFDSLPINKLSYKVSTTICRKIGVPYHKKFW